MKYYFLASTRIRVSNQIFFPERTNCDLKINEKSIQFYIQTKKNRFLSTTAASLNVSNHLLCVKSQSEHFHSHCLSKFIKSLKSI